MIRGGPEPLSLPLPSLLDVIYAWWVWDGTPKDIARFDAELWAPPDDIDEDDDGWSDDDTFDEFAAALGGLRALVAPETREATP